LAYRMNGMNLSRLFTLLGRQSGYQGVLPVGRVQTPTLRLGVDRDRSIAGFVPVPYWAIEGALQAGDVPFTAQWRAAEDRCDDQGRCLDTEHTRQAAGTIGSAAQAQVVKLRTDRMREAPPMPFDRGALLLICSKILGLGAHDPLDIAQALYATHKLTTYLRSVF